MGGGGGGWEGACRLGRRGWRWRRLLRRRSVAVVLVTRSYFLFKVREKAGRNIPICDPFWHCFYLLHGHLERRGR